MIIFDQLGNLGRLGNQFFQVAATISHAKKVGDKPIFNKWKYNQYLQNPIDDGLKTIGTQLVGGVYHELINHSQCHYIPLPDEKDLKLLGFFQSSKYFDKDLVKHHFTPSNKLMEEVRKAGNHIIHETNLTAVHVRRGDYLQFSKQHPPLPIQYYNNAMEYILKKHPGVKFLFFSDDITWCKKTFGKQYYYSEGNKDIVDMYLMAQCRHHIIANSSMSWWGAWLRRLFADIADQVVIAPEHWFGADSQHDTKDIYCENWIKISA